MKQGETLFSFTDFFASSPNKAEYTQESYQRAGLSETLNARPLAEVTFSNFSA